MSDVQQMRGDVTDSFADEETVTLRALVPAASFMDYPVRFASLTGGRGSMSTSLHGYRECPVELGSMSPRRGWIRWTRQNIFWLPEARWKGISLTNNRHRVRQNPKAELGTLYNGCPLMQQAARQKETQGL